jgi:translation initiation factor 1
MRKRDEAEASVGETRLVYSTGGEATTGLQKSPKRSQPPAPSSSKGLKPPAAAGGKGIRVRLERRPGGRDITTVLGVPGRADAIASLARDLRAACGAGGTVREGIIELQGDQCDKVRAVLTAKGIKSR